MQDDLSIFEQRYAMYVLLAVSENPGIFKTQLLRLEEGNERTKYLRINEMIEKGYIKVLKIDDWRAMPLEVTEKGMKAAKLIKELHEVATDPEQQ